MRERESVQITKDFQKELDASEFIDRFRDFDKFNSFCRACPQYERSWACPPFSIDIESQLSQFSRVLLHATKIIPADKGLSISAARELLKPVRMRLEKKFIEIENSCNGLFLGFAGSCPYCPEDSCTRPMGLPCRFPRHCRPSLESYGFDLCSAVSENFGFEILWSNDGSLPSYLTLVCGLFHNGMNQVHRP